MCCLSLEKRLEQPMDLTDSTAWVVSYTIGLPCHSAWGGWGWGPWGCVAADDLDPKGALGPFSSWLLMSGCSKLLLIKLLFNCLNWIFVYDVKAMVLACSINANAKIPRHGPKIGKNVLFSGIFKQHFLLGQKKAAELHLLLIRLNKPAFLWQQYLFQQHGHFKFSMSLFSIMLHKTLGSKNQFLVSHFVLPLVQISPHLTTVSRTKKLVWCVKA